MVTVTESESVSAVGASRVKDEEQSDEVVYERDGPYVHGKDDESDDYDDDGIRLGSDDATGIISRNTEMVDGKEKLEPLLFLTEETECNEQGIENIA